MFPGLRSPRSLLRPDHPDSQAEWQEHVSRGIPWQGGHGELRELGSPLGLEAKRSVPGLMAKASIYREH